MIYDICTDSPSIYYLMSLQDLNRLIAVLDPIKLTHTDNLESQTELNLFGLWEEVKVPRENSNRHGENKQSELVHLQ